MFALNMLEYINLIENVESTIFHKDQTNPQGQIKLRVAVENNSYFFKKLSGTDNNLSK